MPTYNASEGTHTQIVMPRSRSDAAAARATYITKTHHLVLAVKLSPLRTLRDPRLNDVTTVAANPTTGQLWPQVKASNS